MFVDPSCNFTAPSFCSWRWLWLSDETVGCWQVSACITSCSWYLPFSVLTCSYSLCQLYSWSQFDGEVYWMFSFCLFSVCGHMDLIQIRKICEISLFIYFSLMWPYFYNSHNHIWTQAATWSMFLVFNSDTLSSNKTPYAQLMPWKSEILVFLDSLDWDASMSIFHACSSWIFHYLFFQNYVYWILFIFNKHNTSKDPITSNTTL